MVGDGLNDMVVLVSVYVFVVSGIVFDVVWLVVDVVLLRGSFEKFLYFFCMVCMVV